jgi:predicted amidohydrolase YtcJ
MLLVFAVSPSFAEDSAELVLRNGRFYPVSSPGVVEGSLAVRGGRIAYLGPDAGAETFIGAETRTLDLAGRTVTPGLIDAHSHLEGLGAALDRVDLVGTSSYAQVIDLVRDAAASTSEGEWIQGRGWDQNDWQEKAFPEHGPLSEAVPDHPVWMTRIDGHAALLNARAMELLGVDADTADPPGGRFERDAEGRPTGVLVDAAMGVVGGGVPSASVEERERRILAGAEHCLARGLTTVTDMGVSQTTIDAYSGLRKRDALPIRSALFLTDDSELLSAWFSRGPEVDPESRLLVRGVKLYSDGALGSRGAALIEPYSDDPTNNGLLITGGDHIESVCRRSLESGFQVGVHAIGDRGALVTLDAIERCFERPRPEARFRLEHAQVMRLADIERMGRLGVIASMQPTHATSDGPWAEDRVGPRRILGAYAWRKMLDAGALLALGSDFPVESADPRLGLYSSVAREFSAGEPEGGWYPAELLSGEEALRGFTLDAAYSVFLEDEVGSLEVGKRADLVVFSEDVVTAEPARIPRVEVDYTLVDGRIAFDREGAR